MTDEGGEAACSLDRVCGVRGDGRGGPARLPAPTSESDVARRGARHLDTDAAGIRRLTAADRRDGAQHPRCRGRWHPHHRLVVPAHLLRPRGVRQGGRRRRPDRVPAAPRHGRGRRRQRVLPSGVRGRSRAARRRHPHVWCRSAGADPLLLGRRARVVRRAAGRAAARGADVRQLVVADGARRRPPPVLRHQPDRLGGTAAGPAARRRRPVVVGGGMGEGERRRPGRRGDPPRLGARRRREPDHRCPRHARRVDGARRRAQGLGAGTAGRRDVGRRRRLELLVRGVELRRHRRRPARRRSGRAGDRPGGHDG